MDNIIVLGLESSCDDSCVAIIKSDFGVLSNVIIGQREHALYQGVVPEIAARLHLTNLELAINKALKRAKITINDINVIAVTSGPGLIGGVIIGTMFAKALSSVLKKPLIAVNHLEGHALTVKFTHSVDYPYLLLLVSGGHSQFVIVEKLAKYKIIGETLDDSIGETFDKVSKMLNLGFPGGPKIEQKAKLGDKNKYNFPAPLINKKNCYLSFSGLKTAVKNTIDKIIPLTNQDVYDIAASFQNTVSKIIEKKTKLAIAEYEKYYKVKTLVASGGVASNLVIRKTLNDVATDYGYNFVVPPVKLCTDNAVMIAFAGLERFKAGIINNIDFSPRARWNLVDVFSD